MVYLLLSIFSSTCIILTFKLIDRYNIRTFHAIAINYFFASLLGTILLRANNLALQPANQDWLPVAILIGLLFVAMFYIMGITAKKSGVTVTAVAGRISVIIPVLFSILFYRESLGWLKTLGILIALPALFLSSMKNGLSGIRNQAVYLPFILFLGSGLTDSLVKFGQQEYLTATRPYLFATTVFFTSLLASVMVLIPGGKKHRDLFRIKTLVSGGLLGIFNFLSLFFFVEALNHASFDSSVLFGMNHLGIILLSLMAGLLFFREKLSPANMSGIALAFLSIILLYHA